MNFLWKVFYGVHNQTVLLPIIDEYDKNICIVYHKINIIVLLGLFNSLLLIF